MEISYRTEDKNRIQQVKEFVTDWYTDAKYFTVNTSGSTGKPKQIQIQKNFAIQSAKATLLSLGVKNESTALLCLSVDTIGGKMMIVRSIVANLKLIVVDTSANPNIYITDRIDFCAMVPMQVSNTLKNNLISNIKLLIIGGGQVDSSLANQLETQSTICFQTFGMTETISHIALKKIDQNITSYEALEGVTFSISPQETLVINAPKIGVNNLITNDIVELINQKSFTWKGRSDFAINSGGVKIIPEIIEQKLSKLIPNNFFVFGQPDKILGQRLELIIEGENESIENINLESILEKYQTPKKIHFVNKFIITASGKINRIEILKKLKA